MATTIITERPADKQYGYKFGVDGLLTVNETEEMLKLTRDTLDRMADRGEIRKGKLPTGPVRFCKRSVMNYIASLEQ